MSPKLEKLASGFPIIGILFLNEIGFDIYPATYAGSRHQKEAKGTQANVDATILATVLRSDLYPRRLRAGH